MKFRVKIRKEGAPDVIQNIEAPSRFVIYDQIREDGGVVVSIKELSQTRFANIKNFNVALSSGIKRTEVIHFSKNLAAMISAGLSVSRALSVIEKQASNKNLKVVVAGIAESIKKGSSLCQALELYPKVFPELFVAMVRAGEESGTLAQSLNTIGLQMGRSEELKRKVRGAMIYPAIVLTAILIVGVLMLIYVVPTLTSTFKSLGVKVPLATRVIVAISDFMAAHASVVFISILAIFLIGFVFVKSKFGSRVVLTASLHLPVIGELVRETYSARTTRTLSSLLSSGVPVLDALEITKGVVHAHTFAHVIEEAENGVRKGELLSATFSKYDKLYPVFVGDMLQVGEETGKVSEMLGQIAEYYELDVSEKTKDMSTIIEPILMVIIGVFVGIFAVAMIAPIYQLSSAI